MSDPEADSAGVTDGIVLRYWASLRAAAGVETDEVSSNGSQTLSELTARARALHDSRRFADVLSTCSVLVEERPVSSADPDRVTVWPGQTVEFLPPFAGG